MAGCEKAVNNPNREVCNYWRRVSVVEDSRGEVVIALCGRNSLREGLPGQLTDFGERQKCPYGYAPLISYCAPTILMMREGEIIGEVSANGMRGRKAVRFLESRWEKVVDNYRANLQEKA